MRPKLNELNRAGLLLLLFLFINTIALPQPIVIAVEDNAAPWSQKDGTGYANDVVRAAFKAVGKEVKLLVVPYSRGREMVLNGKVVANFSMSWSPDLKGKVTFSRFPLFVCYEDYFVNAYDRPVIRKAGDFAKGTVVGIVSGYEYSASLYRFRDQGIIVLEESESEEINLKKLAKRRIDAALINYNETKPYEQMTTRAGVDHKVARAFRCGVLNSYIGFSMLHPAGLESLKAFNRGFHIISNNGTLQSIQNQWKKKARSEIKPLYGNKDKGKMPQ